MSTFKKIGVILVLIGIGLPWVSLAFVSNYLPLPLARAGTFYMLITNVQTMEIVLRKEYTGQVEEKRKISRFKDNTQSSTPLMDEIAGPWEDYQPKETTQSSTPLMDEIEAESKTRKSKPVLEDDIGLFKEKKKDDIGLSIEQKRVLDLLEQKYSTEEVEQKVLVDITHPKISIPYRYIFVLGSVLFLTGVGFVVLSKDTKGATK